MTNPTPHGQVPEALRLAEQYDHGDPAAHGNAWKAAVCTELRRQHARIAELEAQIEALSGMQALSAAPAGFVPVAAFDRLHAHAESLAARLLAASPTPPAEQTFITPETGNSASAKGAAITSESGTPPAEQQAAPKAAPGVGNSGFDHKTAADFLNGKTVSDEAVRKFVAAARWAHDERAALSATLLAMHGVLTSREAEIALLKKALLEAEAAPQQEPAFWTRQRFGEEREFCEVPFTTDWTPLYTAPQQEAQEPSRAAKTWCSYVAGMIGCYLNEPDESTKVQAIAGIIERRLWALPTPQPAPDCHHRPPCDECAAIAAQGGKDA